MRFIVKVSLPNYIGHFPRYSLTESKEILANNSIEAAKQYLNIFSDWLHPKSEIRVFSSTDRKIKVYNLTVVEKIIK